LILSVILLVTICSLTHFLGFYADLNLVGLLMNIQFYPLIIIVVGILLTYARRFKLLNRRQAKITGLLFLILFMLVNIIIFMEYILSEGWPIIFILVYPLWLIASYKSSERIIIGSGYIVVRGLKYSENVKSRLRLDIAMHKFVVKRNADFKIALMEGLNEFGGLDQLVKPKDNVIIKATITTGNPYVQGSFTNPQLVGVLAKEIMQITGKKVKVVDSDNIWTDFKPIAKIQGWYQAAREFGFELVNLSETEVIKFDFGEQSKLKTQFISTILLQANVIIAIPAMKTDLLSQVHLGLKEMTECFPESNKSKFINLGIDDVIVDMARVFRPTFTIIDGTSGGESIGPLTVTNIQRGETLIFSKDVVVADSVAAQIMGFKVHDVHHIREATINGLGTATVVKFEKDIPYRLPKDGIWMHPQKEESEFYFSLLQSLTKQSIQSFFDNVVDFLINDSITIPILNHMTPVTMVILADTIGGMINYSDNILNLSPDDRQIINQKIGEKIFPEISKENWPSENVRHILEEIGLLGKPLFEYPQIFPSFVEIKDVEEKASFAKQFFPVISTRGLELLSENNSPAWKGGVVQYQLLESKGGSLRVIQILLIWTKQRFVFSYFYNILLPLLLGIFGILLVSLIDPTLILEGLISIILLIGVLWGLGGSALTQFIQRYRTQNEVIIRNQMYYAIYSIIFLPVVLFDIYSKINDQIISIFTFNGFGTTIKLLLPAVSALLFILAFLAGILIILFGNKSLGSHDMDYAPIWIFLSRKVYGTKDDPRNPDHWELAEIRFDEYHYEIKSYSAGVLISKNVLDNDGKVQLEIDNLWHSFHLSKSLTNFQFQAYFSVGLIFLGFIGLIFLPILYINARLLIIALTLSFITLLVGLIQLVAGYRSFLVKIGTTETKESLKQPEKILTAGKLYVLWNLRSELARLKIKEKFIDPFNQNIDWKRWDDPDEQETFLQDDRSSLLSTRGFLRKILGQDGKGEHE